MAKSIYFSDRKLVEKWDPDKIFEFVYWFKISFFLKLYTHSYAKNRCNSILKINVLANKQADKKWDTDIWLYWVSWFKNDFSWKSKSWSSVQSIDVD